MDAALMFYVERFNGRGWHVAAAGVPNRGEALQEVARLRAVHGHRALFRIIVR